MIPELTELAFYYMNLVTVARLQRNPTVKTEIQMRGFSKAERAESGEADSASEGQPVFGSGLPVGFFTYPISQAADITAFKATTVPAGEDQKPMLEQTNEIVRRFNNIYGVEFFPEPQNFYFNATALKVPGLDGSGKMGKSEGNCIYLRDDDKTIRKKVMKAVTDMGPQTPNSPRPEIIENLFTFLKIASTQEAYDYFDEKWNDCTLRYGDLKKQIAEDLCKTIAPIRERIEEFSSNKELLDKIAREGAEAARASASETLNEVRKIIGFRI
jgi:tryptophanyl-tRNA synthetase